MTIENALAANDATLPDQTHDEPQEVEVEYEGKTYVLPAELKDALLRQAGYTNAQQAALSDIGNRFNADQLNTANQLNADQFNAMGAYNAGAANAANDLAGANLRLNASSLYGNQANLLGGLSGTQLDQALQRANAIQDVGAQQTAQQQSQDDAAYQEFLRQIAYPYQQQQLRNQAVSMIPLQQTQTQTTSKSPGVLDVLDTASKFVPH